MDDLHNKGFFEITILIGTEPCFELICSIEPSYKNKNCQTIRALQDSNGNLKICPNLTNMPILICLISEGCKSNLEGRMLSVVTPLVLTRKKEANNSFLLESIRDNLSFKVITFVPGKIC